MPRESYPLGPSEGDGSLPERAPATGIEPGQCLEFVSKYEVHECIYRGRNSSVYRAWDPVLNREVAIKHTRDSRIEEIAKLPHMSATPVLQVAPAPDKSLYIVMAHVHGGNLEEWLAQGAKSERELITVLRDLSFHLHQLHQAGLVHGDIKPSNILMAKYADPHVPFTPILADIDALSVHGTSYYMAPECVKTRRPDVRSDIFSLGVIMYRMLNGTPEPQGDSAPFPLPVRFIRPAPYPLIDVCCRCLEAAPPDRYSSARDFADDLLWCRQQLDRRVSPVFAEHPLAPDPQEFNAVLQRVRLLVNAWCTQATSATQVEPRQLRAALQSLAQCICARCIPSNDMRPSANWSEFCEALPKGIAAKSLFGPSSFLKLESAGRNQHVVFEPDAMCYLAARQLYQAILKGDKELLQAPLYGREIHQFLAAMLRQDDPEAVVSGCKAIGQLRRWLKDDSLNPNIRHFAAFQLGVARAVGAIDDLHQMLQTETHQVVIAHAVQALAFIASPRSLACLDLSRKRKVWSEETIRQFEHAILYIQGQITFDHMMKAWS